MDSSKILFILNSTGVGGAERSIKRMCEGFFRKATVVTLFGHTNSQPLFWDFDFEGSTKNICAKKFSLFRVFPVLCALRRLVRSGSFSVIQSQLKVADIFISFLIMFRLVPSVRYIVSIRNSYDFYYRGGLANRALGALHAWFVRKTAHRVVVVSRQDIRSFVDQFGSKVAVIENSVNLDEFADLSARRIVFNKKEVKVAMVGNVKFRKGYDKLPDLFKLLDAGGLKFRFYIAGGIESARLKTEVVSSASEFPHISAKFLGKVEDIRELLAKCDLFLSLSRMEGLPISVLEAFAARLPVVLSDIEAHTLIVPEATAGRCIFKNLDECANIMLNSDLLDEELVDSHFRLLERRFSFDHMCSEYESVYTN